MLVQDKNDASGMYSQSGRISQERFVMLQQKDQVLYGIKQKWHEKDDLLRDQIEQNTNQVHHRSFLPQGPEIKERDKEHQPFGLKVGRNQRDELNNRAKQECNKNYAKYHPKFHLIFEDSPLYEDADYLGSSKQRHKEMHAKLFPASVTHKRLHKSKLESSISMAKLDNSTAPSRSLLRNSSMMMILEQSTISPMKKNASQSLLGNNIQDLSSTSQIIFNEGNKKTTNDINNSMSAIENKDEGGDTEEIMRVGSTLDSSIKNSLTFLDSSSMVMGIEYDQAKQKVVGPVEFSKMPGRKPLLTPTIPHDKRFESQLALPMIYSGCKKSPLISFEHMLSRNDSIFGNQQGGVQYSPNWDLRFQRQDLGIIDISKNSKRVTNLGLPAYSLNESVYEQSNYDLTRTKSQILKQVKSPIFEKMIPRKWD